MNYIDVVGKEYPYEEGSIELLDEFSDSEDSDSEDSDWDETKDLKEFTGGGRKKKKSKRKRKGKKKKKKSKRGKKGKKKKSCNKKCKKKRGSRKRKKCIKKCKKKSKKKKSKSKKTSEILLPPTPVDINPVVLDEDVMNKNIIGSDHMNILNNNPAQAENGDKIFACGATDKNPETDYDTPCDTYTSTDVSGWSDKECYCNAMKNLDGSSRCLWRENPNGNYFTCESKLDKVFSNKSKKAPKKMWNSKMSHSKRLC